MRCYFAYNHISPSIPTKICLSLSFAIYSSILERKNYIKYLDICDDTMTISTKWSCTFATLVSLQVHRLRLILFCYTLLTLIQIEISRLLYTHSWRPLLAFCSIFRGKRLIERVINKVVKSFKQILTISPTKNRHFSKLPLFYIFISFLASCIFQQT